MVASALKSWSISLFANSIIKTTVLLELGVEVLDVVWIDGAFHVLVALVDLEPCEVDHEVSVCLG
jgi:hypothetical protein